jgi:hypothetical protein
MFRKMSERVGTVLSSTLKTCDMRYMAIEKKREFKMLS